MRFTGGVLVTPLMALGGGGTATPMVAVVAGGALAALGATALPAPGGTKVIAEVPLRPGDPPDS